MYWVTVEWVTVKLLLVLGRRGDVSRTERVEQKLRQSALMVSKVVGACLVWELAHVRVRKFLLLT